MLQDEALRILRTGVNVFLTGEPGSGKTHTVNAYTTWLRERGIEPAVTASTGIAATHLGGMTIHAWSGIGVKDSLSVADLDAIAGKEHVARRIQRTTTLIIDEVSMLSANVLSMVDRVCREVRRIAEPFGGLQVVLVGDFFQLPPIARGMSAAFAFTSPVWEDLNPVMCYLTEQHRQDDPEFLSVLSGIRSGELDREGLSRVLAREAGESEELTDIPRLFTHNIDVDRINQERLETISGRSIGYGLTGTGAPALIEALKRGCLSPERLVLKVGAVVMGTKNLAALGLANGTLGVVVGFERGTNHPRITTNDGRTLTVAPAEWALEEGGRVRAKITQIPLRLAWAITIHKSQGMSMDAAAMDLSRCFEHGQGYVALSRVRRLAGLHLLGWSEAALAVHPEVMRIDAGFRARSQEAEVAFAELEESGERIELEQNFIRASGGSLEHSIDVGVKASRRSAKISTYAQTSTLLAQGMTLREIALERGLTYGTICTHMEKLAHTGQLDAEALARSAPTQLTDALPEIAQVFSKYGVERLLPAADALQGKYDYDDLRIARLLYTHRQSPVH